MIKHINQKLDTINIDGHTIKYFKDYNSGNIYVKHTDVAKYLNYKNPDKFYNNWYLSDMNRPLQKTVQDENGKEYGFSTAEDIISMCDRSHKKGIGAINKLMKNLSEITENINDINDINDKYEDKENDKLSQQIAEALEDIDLFDNDIKKQYSLIDNSISIIAEILYSKIKIKNIFSLDRCLNTLQRQKIIKGYVHENIWSIEIQYNNEVSMFLTMESIDKPEKNDIIKDLVKHIIFSNSNLIIKDESLSMLTQEILR